MALSMPVHADDKAQAKEIAKLKTVTARSMTLEEIVTNKDLNKDRVILHYGIGIVDADLAASALDGLGTPALAIAGGPNNGIQLILSGVPLNSKVFTQANLDRGEVTGKAPKLLKYIQQKQATAPSESTLAIGE